MSSKYKPGTRVSEYLLEEQIGAGSFGEVWRGRHHVWDEQVAIKLPTEPEYVRYLRREGMVVHGLRHANIVGVKGLDPYGEIPYLVMELVDGPSLRQALDEHGRGLPLKVVREVLRGVLEGLAVAHAAGVLHRDLKPGNVLLDLDGAALEQVTADQVKVSDFGLGSGAPDAMRSIVQSASIDRGDKLVGTLAYMAPELRDGHTAADERSDLYAIGVILFEMLTGERPAGAELPSVLRSDAPRALDEIFGKLYARHDRRYASARAVLEDLARLERRAWPHPPLPGHGLPPLPMDASGGPCPKCGAQTEAYDQFCTQCRYQLVDRVRTCAGCGAYPGPHDKFCIFCGLKLAGA